MTILEYLDKIKERFLTDPFIIDWQLIRERSTLIDGHLRAQLTLKNDYLLEFSEYFQLQSDGSIEIITYSYHLTDSAGNLIRRWDNTPHFPGLAGFPHHIHEGATGSVISGRPVNIVAVLDEIQANETLSH